MSTSNENSKEVDGDESGREGRCSNNNLVHTTVDTIVEKGGGSENRNVISANQVPADQGNHRQDDTQGSFVLHENDVVTGRGTGPNQSHGNVRFRQIVWETFQEYLAETASFASIIRKINRDQHATAGEDNDRLSTDASAACPLPLDSRIKNEVAFRVWSKFRESGQGRFFRKRTTNTAVNDDINNNNNDQYGPYELVPEREVLEKIKQTLRFQVEHYEGRRTSSGSGTSASPYDLSNSSTSPLTNKKRPVPSDSSSGNDVAVDSVTKKKVNLDQGISEFTNPMKPFGVNRTPPNIGNIGTIGRTMGDMAPHYGSSARQPYAIPRSMGVPPYPLSLLSSQRHPLMLHHPNPALQPTRDLLSTAAAVSGLESLSRRHQYLSSLLLANQRSSPFYMARSATRTLPNGIIDPLDVHRQQQLQQQYSTEICHNDLLLARLLVARRRLEEAESDPSKSLRGGASSFVPKKNPN